MSAKSSILTNRSLYAIISVGTLIVILLTIFAVVLSIPFVLLYAPTLRWLYITYLIWVWYDRETCDKGARPKRWVKYLPWWRHLAEYFPIKLTKVPKCQLDPKKNYLCCIFPHGLCAAGAIISFVSEGTGFSEVFPNHKSHLCTLKQFFFVPLYRELLLLSGALASSATALKNILTRPQGGRIVGLLVGGTQEAFYSLPGRYKIVLKNRKGFVKIAIQSGSSLVPVIAFGEVDIYSQVEFKEDSLFAKIQNVSKMIFGVGPVIVKANYGIFPFKKPINLIVGEPIDVEKIEKPTQQHVDHIHALFMTKIEELFEEQKRNFLVNADEVKLEIV